jgi:hypothetical protein
MTMQWLDNKDRSPSDTCPCVCVCVMRACVRVNARARVGMFSVPAMWVFVKNGTRSNAHGACASVGFRV